MSTQLAPPQSAALSHGAMQTHAETRGPKLHGRVASKPAAHRGEPSFEAQSKPAPGVDAALPALPPPPLVLPATAPLAPPAAAAPAPPACSPAPALVDGSALPAPPQASISRAPTNTTGREPWRAGLDIGVPPSASGAPPSRHPLFPPLIDNWRRRAGPATRLWHTHWHSRAVTKAHSLAGSRWPDENDDQRMRVLMGHSMSHSAPVD